MREMLYLLFTIPITNLWIQGITIMQNEGMLLHGLRAWSDKYFDINKPTWTKYYLHKICMPLFLCNRCMASVHGLLIYWTLTYLTGHYFSLIEYILVAVMTVATVSFTNKYID